MNFSTNKPRRSKVALMPSAIATNATTSTKILDENDRRKYVIITNIAMGTSNNILVKLQAASVDDDIRGICIPAGSSWEMPTESVYTGEICAISDSGTPSLLVVEY